MPYRFPRLTAFPLSSTLCLALVACGGDGGGALPPDQVSSTLAGSVWAYERFDLVDDGARKMQETDAYYFGEDGRFERYSGFDPFLTGTWEIDGSGDIALVYDGAPGDEPTTLEVLTASREEIRLRDPNRMEIVENPTPGERQYTRSARCPLYLSRSGGRYASYFLDILTPETDRAGWMAADFDSDGELHVIASRSNTQQEGFYATTRGVRCGLGLTEFEGQAAARMEIGPDDTMHVAYSVGTTIRYASRPATAGEEVPWQIVDVADNTLVPPELSLALAPDGSVAIAADGDEGDYLVYRSADPAAEEPTWEMASLPVTREAGNQLIFGVSAAFDAESRLHVAATPNGANITVYRDEDGEWTALPIPDPVSGVAMEGPSSFAIAPDGTWLLAAGSIGTAVTDVGAGQPGPLYLGRGDAESFVWDLVGAGGRAVLDLAEDGTVHLASFDRTFGGQHTVVGDDGIERFNGNVTLTTFDRTALATGPGGRVAIGNSDSVQVLPAEGELEVLHVPVSIELTDAMGSSVVFPDEEQQCEESCRLEMEKGRWVQWEVETASDVTLRNTSGGACQGAELTGSCWLYVNDPHCTQGVCPPAIDLAFAEADVSAVLDPRTAELEPGSWTPYGPVASDGGLALVLTLVGTSTPSQVVRWNADTRAFSSTPIEGWSHVDGLVEQPDGALVLFGGTDAATTIGGMTGFAGERIAVGVDRAGEVSWVTTLDDTAMPTGMVALAEGFAVGTTQGLLRYAADGSVLPAVNAVGEVSFTAARLLGGGTTADIVGPLAYDSANGPTPASAWLRYDADGVLAGQTQIPGTLVSAVRDMDSSVVMALILSAGQEWDSATVAEDAWALARYSAEGELTDAGAPQTAPTSLGSPTGWVRLMAAGVAVRSDGVLVTALETATRQVNVVKLGPEYANTDVLLGGMGLFGARRDFTLSGLAAAGAAAYVGGVANGTFGFVGAEQVFEAPTATLFELP